MTLEGHVKNGVIVLDEPRELPEGAKVKLEIVQIEATPATGENLSLLSRLGPLVGAIDDLPEDASINLKHYLYGHPQK
jgi:hypothetical protein